MTVVSEPVPKIVAEAAEQVSFGPGEAIPSETGPAEALILIKSGAVRWREGVAPVVSLLDGGLAGMSAVALERVDAFVIRPEKKLTANVGSELFRAVDEPALASERPGAA